MNDASHARALIADDEPILAASLQQELADLWPALEIIGIAHDGDEALARILADKPDIVFLDIRMPGTSGIEVAQAIAEDWPGEQAPMIVFVTAHDEFALAAFEQEALDYLTKPVRTDRLARTVARLQQRLAQAPDQSIDALARQMHRLIEGAPSRQPLQWIRAGVGESVRMIPIEQVVYFEAADKYVLVATEDGDALIRESLRNLLPQLDPARFIQVHRGRIVNLHRVISADRDEAGRIRLKLRGRSDRPLVSRVFAHLFRPM